MAQSLDGLIHHLLDQIALHGEQGASPFDFISSVKGYYAPSRRLPDPGDSNITTTDKFSAGPDVDRPFLEQIWKWLIKSPEIRLGEHVGHSNLTLSDVETRNAAIKGAASSDSCVPDSDHSQALQTSERSSVAVPSQGADCAREDNVGTVAQPDPTSTIEDNPRVNPAAGVCASNIEAAAELPKESNTPSKSRPSSGSVRQKKGRQPASKHQNTELDSDKITSTPAIRLYTSESRMWYALAGHAPDYNKIKALDFACLSMIAAHGPKGIDQHDLVKLTGQDPRSLPARTDRLHTDGYIEKKRVTIQLFHPKKRILHTSHLTLKRFIESDENQSKQNRTAGFSSDKETDINVEKDASEAQDRQALVESTPLTVQPPSYSIPQWTPDRPLGNQIYDLVNRSGTQGLTMTNIREKLFGEHVRKPADEYVSRLVDCWQMSQPLHLRHLSIVRDTIMQGKTSIYNYYAYENFDDLVKKGMGFWEAVTTVSNGVTNGYNVNSSLNAAPTLDEYGFPILQPNIFQGESNDASLEECVSALNAGCLHLAGSDPRVKRQDNDIYGIQYKVSQISPMPRITSRPILKDVEDQTERITSRPKVKHVEDQSEQLLPKPKRPRHLTVKKQGRPRKYPRAGDPIDVDNMDPDFLRKLQDSQEMAEKYERSKIEDEISCRIREEGGDPGMVAREVLMEAEALRREEGHQPLQSYSKEMILHMFAGGPEPKPLKKIPQRNLPGSKAKGRRKKAPYWPSMASHTILIPKSPVNAFTGSRLPLKMPSEAADPVSRKRRPPVYLRESENEVDPSPTKKMRYRRSNATPEAETVYLPSAAAHTRLSVLLPSLETKPLDEKAKRKRGRPPKAKGLVNTHPQQQNLGLPSFRYLPSMAAHSSSSQPLRTTLKRKRAPKASAQSDGATNTPMITSSAPAICYIPSIAAHTPSCSPHFLPPYLEPPTTKAPTLPGEGNRTPTAPGDHLTGSKPTLPYPTREVSRHSPAPGSAPQSEGQYPGWIKFMSKYYEPELGRIQRQHDGVFLGETKMRRKRNGEPAGFRPRSFKLVIFKTARLHHFSWFTAQAKQSKSHDQSLVRSGKALPYLGSDHSVATPALEAVSQPWTPVNQASFPPPPFPRLNQLGESDTTLGHDAISSYTETITKKRKRRDSDVLSRGGPPESPFNASPQERESSHVADQTNGLTISTSIPELSGSSKAAMERNSPSCAEFLSAASENIFPSISEGGLSIPNHGDHTGNELPPTTEDSPRPFIEGIPPLDHSTEADVFRQASATANTSNGTDATQVPNMISTTPQTAGTPQGGSLQEVPIQRPAISGPIEFHDDSNQEIAVQPSAASTASQTQRDGDSGAHAPHRHNSVSSLIPLHQPGENKSISKASKDNFVQNVLSPESTPTQPRPQSLRKSFTKLSRKGGSLAILRKNIVMQIMEKCEGIFGGIKELVRPFAVEWNAKGMDGRPEDDTIQNAVTALCIDGKLKEINFAFRNKQGKHTTKRMLTFASISHTDPRVKTFQRNMMAYYPLYYIPKAVMPTEDPSIIEPQQPGTVNDGKHDISQKIIKGKANAAQATLAAMKAEEQRQLEHVNQGESDLRIHSGDKTTSPAVYESTETLRRVPNVPYFSPSHLKRSTPIKRPRGGKVERLASTRKPAREIAMQSQLQTANSGVSSTSRELMWLPEDYAFSEFNFEEERPTVLEPNTIQDTHRPHTRYGTQIDMLEPLIRSPPEYHAGRRMQVARSSTQRKPNRSFEKRSERSLLSEILGTSLSQRHDPPASHLSSKDTGHGQFKSPYAPVRPPSPPLSTAHFRLGSEEDQLEHSSHPSTYVGDATCGKLGKSVKDAENGGPLPKRRRPLPHSPNASRRGSLSSVETIQPPSPLTGQPEHDSASLRLRRSQSEPVDTDCAVEEPHKSQSRRKKLLLNWMDAVHYFHQTTGTFSVAFTGFDTPRQIYNDVGTCSKPYSLGPRNFHSEFPKPRGPRYLLPKRPAEAEDTQFEKEVDCILYWELETTGVEDIEFGDLPFVNHTFNHAHVTAEAVDAKMNSIKEVKVSAKAGRFYSRRFPSMYPDRPKIGRNKLSHSIRDVSAKAAEALERMGMRFPLKRRELTSLIDNTPRVSHSGAGQLNENRGVARFRRIRRPQDSWPGKRDMNRLLTAVVIVRVLTGGLEQRTDWVLVAKAFESVHTQMIIAGRCNYYLRRFKLVMAKMESDFQDLFAEEYEKGSIPVLDFDNLAEYDWNWLTDWTMAKSGTANSSLPDLPKERADFDALYTMNDTSALDINDYYEMSGEPETITRRSNILNGGAFVYAMPPKREVSSQLDKQQFEAAKTWIRANNITPKESYNPEVARAKLATLPIKVIEAAVGSMLNARALSLGNKGRLMPGRNYGISEYFHGRLKKNLLPAHFQRAVAFKSHLDEELNDGGSVPFSYAADDGDVLAILNLLAHKRVKLVSLNVPLNKWGQTDGSYESRHMDKSRLNFQMEIHPLPTYITGNPLLPLPEPPNQHLEDEMGKIPLWYDIHGSLLLGMWKNVLAAVLAVLAVRAGTSAAEIEKALKPALEAWELEYVLQWLVEAKAAVPVAEGYALNEWWWLAFGEDCGDVGDGLGGGKGKGKGKGKGRGRGRGRRERWMTRERENLER